MANMARWLKTFVILSVVAILNIVGFMYISGYAFIISWGTPVRVGDKQVLDHQNHNDVVSGLLRPIAKKDQTSQRVIVNQIDPAAENREAEHNQSLELSVNVVPNNILVLNKSKEEPGLVVKIVQAKQDNTMNEKLDQQSQTNQQEKANINPDVAKKIQTMKNEVEARNAALANANLQLGTDRQNVNPAIADQIGPELKPAERHIDPAILQGIVSKAKPPNDKRVLPHDFNLVINEPNACDSTEGSDVFLLVLVNSIHKNFEQRRAIRATWGSVKTTNGKRVVTMFTLAKNKDVGLNKKLEEESSQHHDILLEDFVDTYKNLTLKTIMAAKYAAIFCEKAQYLMKTDDDMYINYDSLVKYLASPSTPKQNHVAGFVINGGPIRDPKSKWYMPRELYPGSKYPPFCSGTGYVLSGDVALKLYAISEYTPFLYLEDVFIGICLEKLGIVPVKNKEFNNWRTGYSFCRFKRIMTTHMVTPTEMNRIWKDQNSKKSYRC